MDISPELKNKLVEAQRNEITEHFIYIRLSEEVEDANDKKTLQKIAAEELAHYNFWKKLTQVDVKPDKRKIKYYYWVTKLFGLNFGTGLMERGEKISQQAYQEFKDLDPRMVTKIIEQEEEHEMHILGMIDQDRLKYTGSIILGLNDALVELTGALAGLTLAFQQTKIVAVAGLITGIAASLSMAASEYLSTKEEKSSRNPVKASINTGISYFVTVIILIIPYFVFKNAFVALGVTVLLALSIIFTFTFYTAIAKNVSFKRKFLEMASISLAVAAFNFFVGFVVKSIFQIDIS